MSGHVHLRRSDVDARVAVVTLSYRAKFNAMSRAMWRELKDVFTRIQAGTHWRCVLLRGAGAHFCAGGDIGDMAQARMKLAQQQAPDIPTAYLTVETRNANNAAAPAWTGGLKHRAKLDDNAKLLNFAETLEKVTVDTVESGFMTKDLALLVGPDQKWLTTVGFLEKIDENLQKALG